MKELNRWLAHGVNAMFYRSKIFTESLESSADFDALRYNPYSSYLSAIRNNTLGRRLQTFPG
jgi:hypothetical protein